MEQARLRLEDMGLVATAGEASLLARINEVMMDKVLQPAFNFAIMVSAKRAIIWKQIHAVRNHVMVPLILTSELAPALQRNLVQAMKGR